MNMFQLFLTSIAVNGVFFILAAILRTDVFTDITYSLTFAVLTVALLLTRGGNGLLPLLTGGAALVWAFRLGAYLFYRILHIKVDHRFDDKRGNPVSFGLFWLLQAVTVAVVMLPVYGLISLGTLASVSSLPAILLIPGLLLFATGLAFESVADTQKYRFKMKMENKGKFMSTGIWRFSRHPNYFGEMLVWWGIAFPGIFIFRGAQWLYFLGPLCITLLLLFVSGIPLLEKSADAKWGGDEAYRRYKRTTSLLVPLPVRKEKS